MATIYPERADEDNSFGSRYVITLIMRCPENEAFRIPTHEFHPPKTQPIPTHRLRSRVIFNMRHFRIFASYIADLIPQLLFNQEKPSYRENIMRYGGENESYIFPDIPHPMAP